MQEKSAAFCAGKHPEKHPEAYLQPAGCAHWTSAVKLEMLPGVMHRHKHRAAVSGGVTRVTVKQWAARWRSAATEQMNQHTALLGAKIEAFIVCGLQR